MMPNAERYIALFGEAMSRNLPAEAVGMTEADARAGVARAMQAAWQTVEDFATQALLTESRRLQDGEDRQERDKVRGERYRTEVESDSRKVWKSKYGRTIANQLEGRAFTSFAVVSVLDLLFAIDVDRLEEFTKAVRADGSVILVEDSGIRCSGYRLGTQADRIDSADFDDALAKIDAERQRFLSERDARARRTAEEMAASRKRSEEANRYGTAVPSGDDE